MLRASRAHQAYKTGQLIANYSVIRAKHIPDFKIDAVELEDTKTGAKHLHLGRNDSNNLFNLGFKTTPMDDTGVAHILEHTALCGSEKFPVRDPFFKMINRSLQTFMNALTGPDYTMYPFSTMNKKDYRVIFFTLYLDS